MPDADSELRDLWTHYAHEASDARLVTLASIGLVGVVGFIVLIFVDATRVARWWPLVLPAVFAGAFGVWGIADRELKSAREADPSATTERHDTAQRGWQLLRRAASVIAAAAGIGAMLAVLRIGLGTWIS